MISIFLPIRKGSKRIKNKNIKRIKKYKFGLLEIKINQLRKLYLKEKKIKEIIVSTDCPTTKKFVKKFDFIKLHDRDKQLSGDNSLQNLIVVVPKICKEKFILWTHVTSPLYNENDYKFFIKKFLKKNYNSAFSATEIKSFLIDENNKWLSHDRKIRKWPRTQDLKKMYILNNAAFIANRKIYLKYKDRLCDRPLPIISRLNSTLDIDDPNDFNFFIKNSSNLI